MQGLFKQVLYTVKKPILVFFLIILISSVVLSQNLVEPYNDPITYSMGDLRWCKLYGVCTLSMLTLDNLVVQNLSVIGQVFNVTMNLVTWNITDSFNVGGNLEAKNITALDKFIGDGSQLTNIQVSDIWVDESGDTMTGDLRIKDSDGEYHNISRVLQISDEMNRNITLVGLNGTLDLGTGNVTITTLTGSNIIVNIDKNETILDKNSDSIIITSGTNESPIFNQIVYTNAGNPVLAKRTTLDLKAPSVAAFVQGANFTYASAIGLATIDNFIGGLFNRLLRDGSTYRSGFDLNVSTDMVNISTGVINLLLDEVKIISNHSTSDLYVHLHSDDSFHQHLTLDTCASYNDGSSISNNKYYNAVFGIAITHDGAGVMYVITQNKPSTEYTKAIDAEVDIEDTINYFPPDDIVSLAYIPIVRVVMRRSGGDNTIQTLSNGMLYDDLRGTVTKTSSSPPPSGITSHSDLTNLAWSVAGHTIDGTVEFDGNKLNEANITNSSVSAEDIDRDLPTDCPSGTAMYGFGNNMSTTLCRTAGISNGTGYVNFGTINTSTTCINNSCIDDWSEVNVSNGGVTGLDTAYDGGENVIDVDTDDVVWNLQDKDYVIQDNGYNVFNVSDGDLYFGNDTGDQILAIFGSATNPSYSFDGDTDSGFYRTAGNSISFVTGGVAGLQINSAQKLQVGGYGTSSIVNIAAHDSASTGLYFPGLKRVGISAGGTPIAEFMEVIATGHGIAVINEGGLGHIDFRIETNNEENMLFVDGGNELINLAGGYGSTGLTIYDNGSLYMNGNLIVDGFCLSGGVDCASDIAELTHSKASADNTTCNTIQEHQETITHNYYNLTNEECSYQLIGDFYYYVCVNITETYEFQNISDICFDEYKEIEEGKFIKNITCVNETPTWTEEEIITIPKEVECSLNPNFELEFESGDVICIDKEDPQHIKFCEKSYDTSVVGVINYNPTLIIGQRAPYPLSLTGNVPVKVICNTPIEIGDLLVSSNTKGYAQSFKSWIPTKPTNLDEAWNILKKVWENQGSPFAKALENCNSGNKTIRAWI